METLLRGSDMLRVQHDRYFNRGCEESGCWRRERSDELRSKLFLVFLVTVLASVSVSPTA